MTREEPEHRRAAILDAALKCAKRDGFLTLRRDTVAEAAGCSVGLVTYYFANMPKLRRAVMRAAVAREVLPVVAQGITAGDPIANRAPTKLKHAALTAMLGATK